MGRSSRLFFNHPWRSARIINDVSQCRDYSVAERNYLVLIKAAAAFTVAGLSFLFIGAFRDEELTTENIVFASLLLVAAAVICIFAFTSYVQLFGALYVEEGKPRSSFVIGIVAAVAIGIILAINVYEFFEK